VQENAGFDSDAPIKWATKASYVESGQSWVQILRKVNKWKDNEYMILPRIIDVVKRVSFITTWLPSKENTVARIDEEKRIAKQWWV